MFDFSDDQITGRPNHVDVLLIGILGPSGDSVPISPWSDQALWRI